MYNIYVYICGKQRIGMDFNTEIQMTFFDLLHKANAVGNRLNTHDLPLRKDGHPIDFDLEIGGSFEEGYCINIINYHESE